MPEFRFFETPPVIQFTGTAHQRATEGSAGYDLVYTPAGISLADYEALGSDEQMAYSIILKQHESAKLPVGFSMALPPGWEAQIRPRSGLAFTSGITVLNAPGTIDSDYRNHVCVILIKLTPGEKCILPGDRIAQMVIQPVWSLPWTQVDTLPPAETGRNGGFGSTGR